MEDGAGDRRGPDGSHHAAASSRAGAGDPGAGGAGAAGRGSAGGGGRRAWRRRRAFPSLTEAAAVWAAVCLAAYSGGGTGAGVAAAPRIQGRPLEVGVGVYVLNLGKVDMISGTWEADFYLYFTSKFDQYYVGKDAGRSESYFPNAGRGVTMYEVSKLPHITNVTTQYRVKGSFYFEVDTSSYPFESHMLELTFEDPQRTTRDLKFVPDEKYSGLSSNIKFPGFASADIQTRVEVEDVLYPPFDEAAQTFSRIKYIIEVERPKVNSFIKGLLPPLFLLLVVCLNSSVPIKHISQRISVDGTMLVAAVMYHSNLAAQAPPTGRLSIADDVMLTTYSLITLNFAVCLVIIKLDSGGNKEWAQELHGTLELIQWVVTPLSFASLSIKLNVIWLVLTAVVVLVAARRMCRTHNCFGRGGGGPANLRRGTSLSEPVWQELSAEIVSAEDKVQQRAAVRGHHA